MCVCIFAVGVSSCQRRLHRVSVVSWWGFGVLLCRVLSIFRGVILGNRIFFLFSLLGITFRLRKHLPGLRCSTKSSLCAHQREAKLLSDLENKHTVSFIHFSIFFLLLP